MDQVTQQNATLVEEAAVTAESIHQRTAQLTETVAVFELGESERGATAKRGEGLLIGYSHLNWFPGSLNHYRTPCQ
jgi:hypothetical protein